MKKAVFFAVIFAISCSDKKEGSDFSLKFQPGIKLTELKNKKLREISGIAASINNPKLLWAHNDSGSGAEIFLLDENLAIKLKCTLQGVENRDWEDIATGPGPDPAKNYIYIGDIGDNDAQYQYKYIYRFEEPVCNNQREEITISAFDKITFELSDKRKDTETLLLDPKTKNLYVVSKREEPVYIYELKYPYNAGHTLVAEKIISLPFTQIVSGDFSQDGQELLMKNYDHVFYWDSVSGKTMSETLKKSPVEIPYEVEPQGESITWAKDGSGFYTLSEVSKGKKSYLYFYKRK